MIRATLTKKYQKSMDLPLQDGTNPCIIKFVKLYNLGENFPPQVNDDYMRRERMASKFAPNQGTKTQEYFVYFKFL